MRLLLPILFIFSFSALGMNVQEERKSPATPQALLDCLIVSNPTVQLQPFDLKVAEAAKDGAHERPNLEIDWEASGFASEMFGQEASLLYTIELGGKRSARISEAQTQIDLVRAQIVLVKSNAVIEAVRDLYRLRQIRRIREVLEENIEVFQRMVAQYSRAGRLNPEQNVSVNVFELALEDNRLKASELNNEESEILLKIETALGYRPKISPAVLPDRRQDWPNLKESASFVSPELTIAQKELDLARQRLGLEKAEAWPDLKVGPRVVVEPGPSEEAHFGAAAAIEVPLFNRNRGGRAKANAELQKAELKLKLVQAQTRVKASAIKLKYQETIKTYLRSKENTKIEQKHKQLHTLINRGVVAPAMVIELHRQLLEYYTSLHEHELTAVEALWNYQILSGDMDARALL